MLEVFSIKVKSLTVKSIEVQWFVRVWSKYVYRLFSYMRDVKRHLPIALCQNEPQREETYLLTRFPNEDSDQPAHPHSLTRVFVIRTKTVCILVYPK